VGRPIMALEGFRWWLVRHRGNGLTADTWVPMFCVDRRIVDALLTELRRAGVPARCTRLGVSWHLPAHPGRWCLWVGYDAYGPAQERLAEVMPLLTRSVRRDTKAT
jgi:hypothetical protein